MYASRMTKGILEKVLMFTHLIGMGLCCAQPLRIDHVYNGSQQQQPDKAIILLQNSWLLASPDKINTCKTIPDCFQETAAPGIGPFSANHRFYLIGQEIYLTTPGSGQVYLAGPDSILRIDRSFDHRAQQGSIEFVRNDTIWRHGGYGGWSARNIITFFDPTAREWEVYRPLRGTVTPPSLWNHRAMLDGDSLWVFGGYTYQEENPGAGKPNPDLWLFDFGARTWKNTGPLNPALLGVIDRAKNCLVPAGNGRFILFNSGFIATLDLRNNVYTETTPERKAHHFMQDVCPWITSDMIYQFDYAATHDSYSPSDSGQTALLFSDTLTNLFPVRQSITHPIVPSESQEPSGLLLWLTPSTLLAVVTIYLARRRKKRKKIVRPDGKLRLTDEGIVYGETVHTMEPLQVAIIRLLLGAETEVNTNDIMELVQNPNLDYTHNLRIKGQVIENINIRLKSILNTTSDPIRMSPSRIDRRVRTYTIEKTLFE